MKEMASQKRFSPDQYLRAPQSDIHIGMPYHVPGYIASNLRQRTRVLVAGKIMISSTIINVSAHYSVSDILMV